MSRSLDQNQAHIMPEERQSIPVHFHALLNQCQTELNPVITDLCSKMLDTYAKETQLKAVESGVFRDWNILEETIREISKLRPQIIQQFSDNIAKQFQRFIDGRILDELEVDSSVNESSVTALSLVENDDMEISVLITTITTGATQLHSDALYALGRRLAMMNNGKPLSDQEKAFLIGPCQLCYLFSNAINLADIELQGEQSLLQGFQKHVLAKIGPIYDRFNALLVEAGVLPNIVYKASNPNASDSSGMNAEDSSEEPGQDASVVDFQNEVQQDLVQGIMGLLASRRQAEHGMPVQQISGEQVLQRREHLVSTIGNMQQVLGTKALVDNAPLSLDSVRADIALQTQALSKVVRETEPDTKDADLIDMVGMLFEYILNDEDLVDSVKALLCHLHTPYLKIALLDRHFFMQAEHPARQLLDVLSQAGALCDSDDKNTLSILAKIRETVKHVLDEFENDPAIFQSLLDGFNATMEEIKRRQTVVKTRTVDAAKGREKITRSRELVSQAVIERLVKNPEIPKIIESLLMGSWGNFLMIVLLRTDENSPKWKEALQLTDDLIWSVKPKATERERLELKSRLVKIVSRTRSAIQLTGSSEEEQSTIIAKLQKCHELVLLGYFTQVEDGVEHDSAERLKVLKRRMPAEWKESFEKQKEIVEITAEMKQIFSMNKRLEFKDSETGKQVRGRIAWLNDEHSQCLLVNEAGRQIAMLEINELDKMRLDKRLTVMEEQSQPLFDRALSWIQDKVQRESATQAATA